MERIYLLSDERVSFLLDHQTVKDDPVFNRYLLMRLFSVHNLFDDEEKKLFENPSFYHIYMSDDYTLYQELKKRGITVSIFNHMTLVKSLLLNKLVLPENIRPSLLAFFN